MSADRIPAVAEALAEFARGLADQRTANDVLSDLGDICTGYLPADGIGVLLLNEHDLEVATTNSEAGEGVERLQNCDPLTSRPRTNIVSVQRSKGSRGRTSKRRCVSASRG